MCVWGGGGGRGGMGGGRIAHRGTPAPTVLLRVQHSMTYLHADGSSDQSLPVGSRSTGIVDKLLDH